ncbi:hypothetical protein ACWNYO_00075 [Candidatus Vidania fulgoroideorum]
MNFSVVTYGCSINYANINKIVEHIKNMGLVYKNKNNTDYVIISSCSVRQNVINKLYSKLGKIKKSKIIIIGCIMNRKYIYKRFKCVKLITNKIRDILLFLNEKKNSNI